VISVCICTRDRIDSLRIALESLAASASPVGQVVVSDDGDPSSDAVAELCAGFDRVEYLRGPRRGLCANRNVALRSARGELVLFLDDDAAVQPDFLTHVANSRRRAVDPDRLVVTGVEIRDGFVVVPHEQTFLGFQEVPYRSGDAVQTIVMNATVFPKALFDIVQFDERLSYGYDEVDLATRAVRMGYRIEICEEARVIHRPSPIHRNSHEANIDAARLYVTTKRYALTQSKPLKGAAFFMYASAHVLAAGLMRDGLRGLKQGGRSVARGARDVAALKGRPAAA
jgi:glycosyltransferase involved in cell wall biosynthesis